MDTRKQKGAAWIFVLSIVTLLSACQTSHVSEKRARRVPDEALVGQWVGISEEGGYYLLELQGDGSGFFAYIGASAPPTVLRITKWVNTGKRLVTELAPEDYNPMGVQTVEGMPRWSSMQLSVSGRAWERRVVFYREDEREQEVGILKKMVDAYKSGSNAK